MKEETNGREKGEKNQRERKGSYQFKTNERDGVKYCSHVT
jgi:hypothetical protein